MESRPEAVGTKKTERNRLVKASKGLFLKRRIPFWGFVLIFSVLVTAKVFLSALYLKSEPWKITSVRTAHAGEKDSTESPAVSGSEQLREKEKELRIREEEVKKKEAELLPLKERVDARMAQLNELQDKLTALAQQLAEKEKAMRDEKMNHLVSLYSAMDPAKAAAIMDKLKLPTVVLILGHMKGKSAGQILAMMDPEKGASISEELSNLEK